MVRPDAGRKNVAEIFWGAAAATDPAERTPHAVVWHALASIAAFESGQVLAQKTGRPLTLLALLAEMGIEENLVYASPELARGEQFDERSLVFTIGVLVFERLTERHPFGTPDNPERVARIRRYEMGSGVNFFPSVPKELRSILMRAMGPFPEERYNGLQELRSDFTRFVGMPATAGRPRPVVDKKPKFFDAPTVVSSPSSGFVGRDDFADIDGESPDEERTSVDASPSGLEAIRERAAAAAADDDEPATIPVESSFPARPGPGAGATSRPGATRGGAAAKTATPSRLGDPAAAAAAAPRPAAPSAKGPVTGPTAPTKAKGSGLLYPTPSPAALAALTRPVEPSPAAARPPGAAPPYAAMSVASTNDAAASQPTPAAAASEGGPKPLTPHDLFGDVPEPSEVRPFPIGTGAVSVEKVGPVLPAPAVAGSARIAPLAPGRRLAPLIFGIGGAVVATAIFLYVARRGATRDDVLPRDPAATGAKKGTVKQLAAQPEGVKTGPRPEQPKKAEPKPEEPKPRPEEPKPEPQKVEPKAEPKAEPKPEEPKPEPKAKPEPKEADEPAEIAAGKQVGAAARICGVGENGKKSVRVAAFVQASGRVVRSFANKKQGVSDTQLACIRKALKSLELSMGWSEAGFIEWSLRIYGDRVEVQITGPAELKQRMRN